MSNDLQKICCVNVHFLECSVNTNVFDILFNYILLPSRLGQQITPIASLQRGKTPPNEFPGYDTKQSDGEVPVILEIWRMRSTLHCHLSQVHCGPKW